MGRAVLSICSRQERKVARSRRAELGESKQAVECIISAPQGKTHRLALTLHALDGTFDLEVLVPS